MGYIPTVWADNVTDLAAAGLNKMEQGIAAAGSSSDYISVRDFGAVGDGVTDDTAAIQAAIDSASKSGVVFFPSTGSSYISSTLTISKDKGELKLAGSGMSQTLLKFKTAKCFSCQTYGSHFEDLKIIGPGIMTAGSVIFSDDRSLIGDLSADFDISMKSCFILEAETVVNVCGRGVIIESCAFFDIRYHYIKVNFPALATWVDGPENTQYYTSGMRGFIFRDNRSHYCPCVIISNTGVNAKNIQGVLIQGNQLEGSTGYVEGYMRNLCVKANVHYECGNIREALFMFDGCDCVDIDMQVYGKENAYERTAEYCNRIVGVVSGSTSPCNNLSIKANVSNVFKDAFRFTGGGTNIEIDVVARSISQNGPGTYGLVLLEAGAFNGLKIHGVVSSPHTTFTAIKRNPGIVAKNVDIDLVITGDYAMLDNLDGSMQDGANHSLINRKPYIGLYGGNGNASQVIPVPFQSSIVQISANGYHCIKSVISSALAPEIAINSNSFTAMGAANDSTKLYAFIAK